MLDDQQEPETKPHLFKLGETVITPGDTIKVIIAIVGMAMAWQALQGRLELIDTRLDRMEQNQSSYVRSDVQAIQNQLIQTQLSAINAKLEDIKKAVR